MPCFFLSRLFFFVLRQVPLRQCRDDLLRDLDSRSCNQEIEPHCPGHLMSRFKSGSRPHVDSTDAGLRSMQTIVGSVSSSPPIQCLSGEMLQWDPIVYEHFFSAPLERAQERAHPTLCSASIRLLHLLRHPPRPHRIIRIVHRCSPSPDIRASGLRQTIFRSFVVGRMRTIPFFRWCNI